MVRSQRTDASTIVYKVVPYLLILEQKGKNMDEYLATAMLCQ